MTKPKSCVSYSVLYYKRAANTKKVHQRKGVTTLDGVLTIHSDSFRIVLRSADGADVPTQNDALNAWSKAAKAPGMLVLSSVQRDVAQQTWSEDDEFTVGPYRIEILKRLDPNENCSPVINNIDIVRGPSVVHGQTVRTGVPMQALPSRTRLPLKRKALPLQSTSTLSSGRRVIGALARKTIPATTPAIGSIAQSCELVKSGIASKCTVDKGTSRTLLPTARPSPPTMVRRTPLVSRSNTTTTTSQSNLKRRTTPLMGLKYTLAKNRAKLASCPATRRYLPGATSTSTIPATNTSPPQSSTNLLANVPLPASVRSVLRPHQEEGVEFLWQALAPMAVSGNEQNDTQSPARGAIFADEMGLGKTLMTIAIIAGLHRRQRDKQFIVVCPSSLVTNWAREFDKWIGRASQPKRVVIQKGGEEGVAAMRAYCAGMLKKKKQLQKIGQVLIVSYDLLRRQVEHLQDACAFGLLVVDEGHRLKNTSGSLTLTALESLTADARLCITATPMQNNLSEFYNLVNFVRPDVLGSLNEFRDSFDRPISAANHKHATPSQIATSRERSSALETLTKPFILRRLQADVLKSMLPPRVETLLFCRPSETQRALYHQLTARISGGSCTDGGTDALKTLTTLRKICTHPSICNDDNVKPWNRPEKGPCLKYDIALSGKMTVLDKLLQSIRENAPNDKIVVVSNYTSALTIVESLILGPRKLGFLRLDGGTESSQRQPLVESFNRSHPEKVFCLLLSSKAGGCGLNLVGANRLLLLDPDWNPASDVQAMARVYRQGQTKPCWIYRLFTTGTVEEVILQRQLQKGNLTAWTVDGGKSSRQNSSVSRAKFSKEELTAAFTLKDEYCICDTKQKMGLAWPAYNRGTLSQYDDAPMKETAMSLSETLSFVHVVNDDACAEEEQDAALSTASSTHSALVNFSSNEVVSDTKQSNCKKHLEVFHCDDSLAVGDSDSEEEF